MVLSDFQRGRLPYFVPPPKLEGKHAVSKPKEIKPIKFVPATDVEESKESGDGENSSEGRTIRGVRQDLTKISVEPDFMDEDKDGGRVDEELVHANEDLADEVVEEDMEEGDEGGEDEDEPGEDEDEVEDDDMEDDVEDLEIGEEEEGSHEKRRRHTTEKPNEEKVSANMKEKVEDGIANKTTSKSSKSKIRKEGKKGFGQKIVDDEVSFKVSKTTSEASEEEDDSDSISKIKAKIENEDEGDILKSLTPEEKLFLGLSEKEEEEASEDGDDDQSEEDDEDEEDDENQEDEEDEIHDIDEREQGGKEDVRFVQLLELVSIHDICSSFFKCEQLPCNPSFLDFRS